MTESLRLGIEVTLTKRPKDLSSEVRRVALPDRVPKWKGIPLDVSYSEQPFEYVSKAAEPKHQVCLTKEGLSQLYVCFGAPGTGKSFLILQLLKQLAKDWEPRWGGLLLDPKQTLLSDVHKEVANGNIPKDLLHVISPTATSQHTNLLCSNLEPRDLGVALALAAESAGISTKEPYWLNEMKRIFGAGLTLLAISGEKLTLRNLAQLLLGWKKEDGKARKILELRINKILGDMGNDVEDRKVERAVSDLSQFTETHGDNAETVRSFINQVLSPFLDPELDYLSDDSESQNSIADLIIRDGMWVLLEVPRKSLGISRMLSALAKILFQRAALDRFAAFPQDKERQKKERPIFLFVDEYAELASDLPGDGFGDSIFFSQARQFKVLSFIATQGVPMLENSGVREAWKTILSNSAGKLFFRVADPDTAELASKLLGEGNLIVKDKSVVQSPEGGNVQRGEKIERRTILTSDLFATGLKRGQFVFLGVTDGGGGDSFARAQYVDGDKRRYEESKPNA